MAAQDDLEQGLDRLYAGPLDAFVRDRDALAASLKKAGDKAGAAAVKARARPSVSAWVVNRLWREARAPFDALLAAGDDLKEAQRCALAGGGADKMKAAMAARRAAVAKLLARAKDALDAGGHPASAATLQRVASTLNALAGAGDRGELGRMSVDVVEDELAGLLATGADFIPAPRKPEPEPAPVPVPAPEPEPEPVPEPVPEPDLTRARERARDRALAIQQAEERLAAAEHACRAAEAADAAAKRALDATEKKKESSRAAVDARARDARAAEEKLREAQGALEAAEGAARAVDHDATLAERAAEEAHRARDRADAERDAAAQALRHAET
jgi:hypothetical protein